MKRTPPKLSKFWRVAPPTNLFLQEQRAAKLDGSAVHIRRAVQSDLVEIHRVTLAAKAIWGYSEAQLAAWRESLLATVESIDSWPTLVAEVSSQVVGVVQVDPTVDPWELVSCWVAPSHMRRGIGAALLRAVAAELLRLGQELVHIDSDPNAEGFYLAQGAVRVGEVSAPIQSAVKRVRPQLRLAVGKA